MLPGLTKHNKQLGAFDGKAVARVVDFVFYSGQRPHGLGSRASAHGIILAFLILCGLVWLCQLWSAGPRFGYSGCSPLAHAASSAPRVVSDYTQNHWKAYRTTPTRISRECPDEFTQRRRCLWRVQVISHGLNNQPRRTGCWTLIRRLALEGIRVGSS